MGAEPAARSRAVAAAVHARGLVGHRIQELFRFNGFEGRAPKPEEAAVPRYFFHVRDTTGLLVEDPDGTELPDTAAARAEAAEAAREVMAEHIRKGEDVSGWRFEVTNEHDQPVLSLLFRDAVKQADL